MAPVLRILTVLHLNRLDVQARLSLPVGKQSLETYLTWYSYLLFLFFPFQIVCGISSRNNREMSWTRNLVTIYNNIDKVLAEEADHYEIEQSSTGSTDYFNLVVIILSLSFKKRESLKAGKNSHRWLLVIILTTKSKQKVRIHLCFCCVYLWI